MEGKEELVVANRKARGAGCGGDPINGFKGNLAPSLSAELPASIQGVFRRIRAEDFVDSFVHGLSKPFLDFAVAPVGIFSRGRLGLFPHGQGRFVRSRCRGP